jgi:hypothetical protein
VALSWHSREGEEKLKGENEGEETVGKLRREAAPVLRCVFKRGLMAGARGKAGKRPGGRDQLGCRGAGLRWEEELTGGTHLSVTT